MCVHECGCAQRLENGIIVRGDTVVGGSELPNAGTGNQTRVL